MLRNYSWERQGTWLNSQIFCCENWKLVDGRERDRKFIFLANERDSEFWWILIELSAVLSLTSLKSSCEIFSDFFHFSHLFRLSLSGSERNSENFYWDQQTNFIRYFALCSIFKQNTCFTKFTTEIKHLSFISRENISNHHITINY